MYEVYPARKMGNINKCIIPAFSMHRFTSHVSDDQLINMGNICINV